MWRQTCMRHLWMCNDETCHLSEIISCHIFIFYNLHSNFRITCLFILCLEFVPQCERGERRQRYGEQKHRNIKVLFQMKLNWSFTSLQMERKVETLVRTLNLLSIPITAGYNTFCVNTLTVTAHKVNKKLIYLSHKDRRYNKSKIWAFVRCVGCQVWVKEFS